MIKLPEIGDLVRRPSEPGEHLYRVIDRQASFFTLVGTVAGKEFNVSRWVMFSYEMVGRVKVGRAMQLAKEFTRGDVIRQRDDDLDHRYLILEVNDRHYVAYSQITGRQAWLDRPKTDDNYFVVEHVESREPDRYRDRQKATIRAKQRRGRALDL